MAENQDSKFASENEEQTFTADEILNFLKVWSVHVHDQQTIMTAMKIVEYAAELARDLEYAAGECRVELPKSGTDAAKLLAANRLLRDRRKRGGAMDRDEIFVRMMAAQLTKVVVSGGGGTVGGWDISVGRISRMADVAEAVTDEVIKRLDAARAASDESEAGDARC